DVGMVLAVMLETYRLPLASKARAVGPCSPVVAKLPRSTPEGENSRMVLPPWLATKRNPAQAGAQARLSAIKRLPIIKWKQVLEEWCISVAPFERLSPQTRMAAALLSEMPSVGFAERLATPERETGAVTHPFQAGKGSLEGEHAWCPYGGQNSSGAAAPGAMRP